MNDTIIFVAGIASFIIFAVLCILFKPSVFTVGGLILAMVILVCYFLYIDGD